MAIAPIMIIIGAKNRSKLPEAPLHTCRSSRVIEKPEPKLAPERGKYLRQPLRGVEDGGRRTANDKFGEGADVRQPVDHEPPPFFSKAANFSGEMGSV
jgi:hypothetical protein